MKDVPQLVAQQIASQLAASQAPTIHVPNSSFGQYGTWFLIAALGALIIYIAYHLMKRISLVNNHVAQLDSDNKLVKERIVQLYTLMNRTNQEDLEAVSQLEQLVRKDADRLQLRKKQPTIKIEEQPPSPVAEPDPAPVQAVPEPSPVMAPTTPLEQASTFTMPEEPVRRRKLRKAREQQHQALDLTGTPTEIQVN